MKGQTNMERDKEMENILALRQELDAVLREVDNILIEVSTDRDTAKKHPPWDFTGNIPPGEDSRAAYLKKQNEHLDAAIGHAIKYRRIRDGSMLAGNNDEKTHLCHFMVRAIFAALTDEVTVNRMLTSARR